MGRGMEPAPALEANCFYQTLGFYFVLAHVKDSVGICVSGLLHYLIGYGK